MLPSELLISRHSGEELTPKRMSIAAKNLEMAEELIGIFASSRGATQGELNRQLLELEGEDTDYRIKRGLAHLLKAKIAEGLSRLLADTYTLYLKTHNFHWNVTGPMFNTLHLMFETQYNELALAVDLIAERIRALGYPAPGTYSEYTKLSSILETSGVPKANEMIRLLVEGQEAVVRTARSIFPLLEEVNDEPSADLLTQRMQVHEKTAWMLRSLLEE
ncbi:MAG: DUF790 family protein [Microcoleus sp. SM1_3_4]|nr:DUF790 family protein [Microcoleus sp. SM1_3_4]